MAEKKNPETRYFQYSVQSVNFKRIGSPYLFLNKNEGYVSRPTAGVPVCPKDRLGGNFLPW